MPPHRTRSSFQKRFLARVRALIHQPTSLNSLRITPALANSFVP